MNQVDSERLAAFLESRGFKAVADFKKAGVVIINTCGIRQPAEDRAYGLANQVRKYNPTAKIVIAGCLSRREDVKRRLKGRADIFLPISEMLKLPELLAGEEFNPYFSLEKIRLSQGEKYLGIPSKHNSKFTAYIPIGNGCNNFCSYCVVPYARGREIYRPAQDIVKEARTLVKAGYKEIVLVAQNVNSYRDATGSGGAATDFSKLLKRIAAIPGKFWIRFSSSHPKDMSDGLIKVIGSSEKICNHLHLAVQSGDDLILKAMNRRYNAAHYKNLIKKVRAVRPDIAITTDVIVGFPGETRRQFGKTVKLFKDVGFSMAYISQYSPRPGTAAYRLADDVTPVEKKRRAYFINEILKKTASRYNKQYLGQTVVVLAEGKNKRGQYYGKTSTYQTVLINNPTSGRKTNGSKRISGMFVSVKITQARPFGLEGELVK